MTEPEWDYCHLCWPEAVSYGELAPGLTFIYGSKSGSAPTYNLLDSNGHDALLTLTEKPYSDLWPPDVENAFLDRPHDDPELQALVAEDEKWIEAASAVRRTLFDVREDGQAEIGLRFAWRLVETLRKAGYNPDEDGDAEFWIFDRMGKMVEKQS